MQYKHLLTNLRFSYQLIVARKPQRLEEYLDYLEGEAGRRVGEGQGMYADYLNDCIEFVKEVARRVNPQVPLYLVVLPYDPLTPDERLRGVGTLTADRYRKGLKELARRTEQVVHELTRLSLGARRLDNQELVGVLQRVYHPYIPDYNLPPTTRVQNLIG